MKKKQDIITRLGAVIAERKKASPESSYVARLFSKGTRKIAQKVGEEGVEVALAVIQKDRKEVVSESADLLFHLMIAWEHSGVTFEEVADELEKREGMSGIAEKSSRKEK